MKKTIIFSVIALLVSVAFVVWKWQLYLYERETGFLERQLHISAKFLLAIDDREKIARALQESESLLTETEKILPYDSGSVEENVRHTYESIFSRQQVKAFLYDSRKENNEFYKAINHTFLLEGGEENVLSSLKYITESREELPDLLITLKSLCAESSSSGKGINAWQVTLETYSNTGKKLDQSAKPKQSIAEKLKVTKSRVWLPPFSTKILDQQKSLVRNTERILEHEEAVEVLNAVIYLENQKKELEKRLAVIRALHSNTVNTVDLKNVPLCSSGR